MVIGGNSSAPKEKEKEKEISIQKTTTKSSKQKESKATEQKKTHEIVTNVPTNLEPTDKKRGFSGFSLGSKKKQKIEEGNQDQ